MLVECTSRKNANVNNLHWKPIFKNQKLHHLKWNVLANILNKLHYCFTLEGHFNHCV